MFYKTFAFMVSAVLLNSTTVLAHSEHDKARFVSFTGNDTGKCDQVLRPCKTIAYAVQQANKGDSVLVASGEYSISSSEELFYLKSALVPIFGGYNRFDHFQSQSPDTNVTTLRNIPLNMAEPLREQGFVVMADGKSLFKKGSAEEKQLNDKLASYYMLSEQQSSLECVDGKAGSFSCENIDLLAHMPLSQFSSNPNAANDIWGHVDLNTGDEYALIGLRNGVAVVNVSDPENPDEVGTIRGLNSTWRDIKVYQYFDRTLNAWQAYAYSTIDNSTDYVTIINLNQLPHAVSLVEKNRVVTQAHNVYITNVDYSLNVALPGLAPSIQLIGSNRFGGAFHSYSLEDPSTLTNFNNVYFGSGYTHDGASINITDDRKERQCGTSNDSCTVFIDFNEKEMKLWNISDPTATELLGSGEYNDVPKSFQYVHSGWGTENKQHVFLHDEFDEKDAGLNSTVRIFSIADLTNPTQVGQWTGPTRAIDHNGFVRGNRYYMSNYERGLTVLDITDPANPVDVGFFDTYTPSDNAGFNGAWGTYPFLPSGNILVSDIGSGLYILRDRTKQSPQGKIGFDTNSMSTPQGQTLSLTVQRDSASASNGAVSVNYQILSGSAEANTDYTPVSGVLTWAENDVGDKTITIDIATDATGREFQEQFFVRLTQPTGGASLNTNSYITVNVEGIVDMGTIAFAQEQTTVAENQNSISLVVSRTGSTSGEVSVSYNTISGNAIINEDVQETSGTLTWADNDSTDKSILLAIIDDELEESDESFIVRINAIGTARLGATTDHTIVISDDDANTAPKVTLSENMEVNSGATVNLTATVVDDENDPLTYLWQQTAGTEVSLQNSDTRTVAFVAPDSAGDVVLSFTATDSKNSATSDEITITIIAAPVTLPTPDVDVDKKQSSGGGSIGLFSLLLLLLLVINRKRFIPLSNT